MAKILIATSESRDRIGRVHLIAAVLKDRGHDVTVVRADQAAEAPGMPEIDMVKFGRLEGCRIVYSSQSSMPAIERFRERDYPTLKQGLRMPHIKGGNSKCAKYQGAPVQPGARRKSATTAGRSSSRTRDSARD